MTARSGIGDAPQLRADVGCVTEPGPLSRDLVFDGLTQAVVMVWRYINASAPNT